MELPERLDWSLPAFRRWVKWRYDMFSAYWIRLVDSVHAVFPSVRICFNHYHRSGTGWGAAIPLNPFGVDFLSSTEADGSLSNGMFYTRVMRAYGRIDTEVWLGLGFIRRTIGGTRITPRPAVDFALACATAGGHCSFGSEAAETAITMSKVRDALAWREPYIGLPSVPHIGLHLSQQTETFVFGRDPAYTTVHWRDRYWHCLHGWHSAVAHGGLFYDILFDDHITGKELAKYPVLIMPFAIALSEKQYAAVMKYVSNGGFLITGPWFGMCDEAGEVRGSPFGDRKMFPFGEQLFTWEELGKRPMLRFKPAGLSGPDTAFSSRPLHCLVAGKNAIGLPFTERSVIRTTSMGKGKIVQLAVDIGSLMEQSGRAAVVKALRRILDSAATPIAEIEAAQGMWIGVFTMSKKKHIIQLQQFCPPWDFSHAEDAEPPFRPQTRLVWRGPRPISVRCVAPPIDYLPPIRKRGDSWIITLPGITWGQAVVIET